MQFYDSSTSVGFTMDLLFNSWRLIKSAHLYIAIMHDMSWRKNIWPLVGQVDDMIASDLSLYYFYYI
jgi:hypothetical protein